MGRAHDVKGFWHLIKSVFLVKKTIPDVKLMLIGAGDFNEYRKLAGKLGIENDILFTGVQKNPIALLARADVYALTSESEGFPNALIEAMAVGLPCVSVNCKTGPAEILQDDYQKSTSQNEVYDADYGILTPIFQGQKDLSPDSFTSEESIFAGELERLLMDGETRTVYQKQAVKRAGDFGVEAYVREIEKLIEEDVRD